MVEFQNNSGTYMGQSERSQLRADGTGQAPGRRVSVLVVTVLLLASTGAIMSFAGYVGQRSIQIPAPVMVAGPLCGTWQSYLMPSSPSSSSNFVSVDALSRDDVWFVGSDTFAHWDGHSVSTMSSPQLVLGSTSGNDVAINDAAFSSDDDGWAVGRLSEDTKSKLLLLHWDGVAWSVADAPDLPAGTGENDTPQGSKDATLENIAIISPNDAWAVGYYSLGSVTRTLALHWNGLRWSVVQTPDVGNTSTYLTSVVARSSDDVWAFGLSKLGAEAWESIAISMRWNGTIWEIMESPTTLAEIGTASVAPSKDIWVASSTENVTNLPPDGISVLGSAVKGLDTSWNEFRLPRIDYPVLRSVLALSMHDVWAVGFKWSDHPSELAENQKGARSMVVHWDGQVWSEISAPNPLAIQYLRDVSGVAGDIWAVGSSAQDKDGAERAMAAHFTSCAVTTKR